MSWRRGANPPKYFARERNLERLHAVSVNAAVAINTMHDPIDKMTVITFLIYTDYHCIALSSPAKSIPDCAAGKLEAQKLLEYYIEHMNELWDAAKAELSLSGCHLFKDKAKQKSMLFPFINLSDTVYALLPACTHVNHPRFQKIEDAVLHAYKKDKKNHRQQRFVILLQNCRVASPTALSNGTMTMNSWKQGKTLKVQKLENSEMSHTLRGHTCWACCCHLFAKSTKTINSIDNNTFMIWGPMTSNVCSNTL